MSKRGANPSFPQGEPCEDLVFISGEGGEVTRTPSVAAKPRLMARSAPLADLAAGAN